MKVTGGPAALAQLYRTYREKVGRFRRELLAERSAAVRNALEHAGCAVTLAKTQTDLFDSRRGAARVEDTRDAAFLMNLLSYKATDRRKAYPRLVEDPPESGEALRQTFYAVYALIEADLRSPFVQMFLSLQKNWPADFTHLLRDLAARGDQGDRIYVVNLIRTCGKEKNEQVRRTFHLERDGDLDAIVESNGDRLWGRGFSGAADSN